jgi:hypothetical protein
VENSEENDRGGVVKKKKGYDILNIGKELRGEIEKYEFKVLNSCRNFTCP